ncbi:MAG: class I SAM-dependent methyltransferase [Candidatus Acetothermia bacterium]
MTKTEPFDNYSEEYDNWFEENEKAYRSELLAVEELLPEDRGSAVEIGVGSGRFASELGIPEGVEPSEPMAEIARGRGIAVREGRAEDLPLENESYDLAVLVTTICFVDDLERTFAEAHRILKEGGRIVVGFVPGDSEIGRFYRENEANDKFYGVANFFTAGTVIEEIRTAGFDDLETVQTLTKGLESANESVEGPKEGFHEGSFVVVSGKKV